MSTINNTIFGIFCLIYFRMKLYGGTQIVLMFGVFRTIKIKLLSLAPVCRFRKELCDGIQTDIFMEYTILYQRVLYWQCFYFTFLYILCNFGATDLVIQWKVNLEGNDARTSGLDVWGQKSTLETMGHRKSAHKVWNSIFCHIFSYLVVHINEKDLRYM